MAITREQFLKGKREHFVTVPTTMGDVRLKALTYTERVTKFEQWLRPDGVLDKERQAVSGLKLMALCVVDESGETIFTEDDFDEMKNILAIDLTPVLAKCSVLCGLDEADEADLLGESIGSEAVQSDNGS